MGRKVLLFTLLLFFFSAIPVFAQLDYYRVDQSLVYPEIYIPQKIISVKDMNALHTAIASTSAMPVAYAIVGTPQTPDFRKYSQATLPKLSVKKLNNARYILSIDNATNDFVLVFNQNYDGGWQLTQTSNEASCNGKTKVFKAFNLSWCEVIPQRYNPVDNLSDFLNGKQITASHFSINGLGNAWLIHPQSSHIDFVMHFVVQDYFFLGLMISLITVSGSVVYLLLSKK
jgi:hypothetical protein